MSEKSSNLYLIIISMKHIVAKRGGSKVVNERLGIVGYMVKMPIYYYGLVYWES